MMLIDDNTLHLLNALLTPGVLGGLGLRWFIQRRNGNHHVTSGQFKTAMEGIDRRFKETRGWIQEIADKQEGIRKKQGEIGERVARIEGPKGK